MTATTKETPKPADVICWRMITGKDADGRPVYDDWGCGVVIEPDDDPAFVLVRRTSYPSGTALVQIDRIISIN